jgi:hypothetical protein
MDTEPLCSFLCKGLAQIRSAQKECGTAKVWINLRIEADPVSWTIAV